MPNICLAIKYMVIINFISIKKALQYKGKGAVGLRKPDNKF